MPDTPAPTADPAPALGLAVRLLTAWATEPALRTAPAALPSDPGIPALAHVVAGYGVPEATGAAARAVAVWAGAAGRGPAHTGLYDGGLSGTLVGLRLGALLHPPLHRAADRLGDRLVEGAGARRWRREGVRLADYDLITGPSGMLLALCAVGGDVPAGPRLEPFTAQLGALCDGDDLGRLRTDGYTAHPHLSWLQGRINTGMGHGVAGLVAALTAALRRTGPEPTTAAALGRAAGWLAGQSYVDERGLRTWPGAATAGPPPPVAAPRQAWCYGTPGVAWALWDAADVLGDRAAAEAAADAFTTVAERYDEGFHLSGDRPGDLLGLCHGAAGVLALAEAFERYARLPAAGALRARLVRRLEDGLGRAGVREGWGPDLLTGAAGALAGLLTAGYGGSRAWLPCLGLR
ncbi:lanthionine synthetase LanC family protein [Streptomyces coeruleoprunus]|uniref:Lanthionine synthetase LanC family protein n=1 Tax=Streptomyces coeruleoprunus TaxID=285563 RepID=A0ABV9XJ06_9ACTN